MTVGDKLKFKKFNWVITRKIKHHSGSVEYKYRVYRKYFRGMVPLSNTRCEYTIFPWRWNFLKKELEKNPNFMYNMTLWSNHPR